MTLIIVLILLLFAIGAFVFRSWSKQQTVRKLLETALSDHQRAIIVEHVPLTEKLPSEFRAKLEGKIQVFLHQIEFVGCNGLEVTEEMQLSIAAQACLLVVNNDAWYEDLHTVLIYPGAFKSRTRTRSGYVVTERETVRSGESWPRGPVVLSWAHTEQGALNYKAGHNVVLHEFAHQLDDLSGRTDGAPILNKGQSLAEWERVFTSAFKRHVRNVENGHKTVIDPYGAEGPEEFFAVAVEVFFERPAALNHEEPAVYRHLAEFFRLEPITWE